MEKQAVGIDQQNGNGEERDQEVVWAPESQIVVLHGNYLFVSGNLLKGGGSIIAKKKTDFKISSQSCSIKISHRRFPHEHASLPQAADSQTGQEAPAPVVQPDSRIPHSDSAGDK
jgi:hypothetical protein